MKSDDYTNPNSLAWKTRLHTDENAPNPDMMMGVAPRMTDVEVADEHMKRMAQIQDEEKQARESRVARDDFAKQKEMENTLKNVYKSQEFDKSITKDMDLNERLALAYNKVAKDRFATDPVGATKLLEKANEMSSKASTSAEKGLKVLSTKEKYKAEKAWGVKDEESLKEGIDALQRAGITIPDKYKVWNDETKAYFKDAGKMSQSHSDLVDMNIKIQTADRLNKEQEIKEAAQKQKIAYQDKKIALVKENMVTKGAKPLSMNDSFSMGKEIESVNPEFANLPSGQKTTAANDYFREILNVQINGGITDIEQASAMARDIISARIKDGKYHPAGVKSTPPKAASVDEEPTEEDINFAKSSKEARRQFIAHYRREP